MQNLLLTISIPTYNGGDNLIRAIKSCKYINLSKNEFEILVVDNCSTDGSIEKVRSLMQDFPNIRLIINDRNYGRIGNWNRCLDLATGKYLIFLFSNDQISEKNKISHNIEQMTEKNIFFSMQPYEKKIKNNIYLVRRLSKNQCLINSKEFLIKNLDKFNFPFAPIQSNIYNLDIIKKYNINFCEKFDLNGDQLFSIEVILKNTNFLYYPNPQIVWEFTKNRFHSKVNISKVIIDDFKLLNYLITKFKLRINYNNVICLAFIRVLRNKEWGQQEGKYKSYIFILKKIFIYRKYGFFLFCLKKIINKLFKRKEK